MPISYITSYQLVALVAGTEPNGTVERFGGHINDIQRTMIIDANMPEEMWPDATDAAIYVYNKCTLGSVWQFPG
ncbi:unnamed protein product [Penicillium viridicatum]